MNVHTWPCVTSWINFWFLTDAPSYMSDNYLLVAMAIGYLIWNYYFYHTLGWVMYPFSDWSSLNYTTILIVFGTLTALILFDNTLISVIS